jgi:hypothetical protein
VRVLQVAIAHAGSVPALVALLRSGTPIAQENAAGALLHITRTRRQHDDKYEAVTQEAALAGLIALLGSSTPVAQEYAAEALRMLGASPTIRRQIIALGCPGTFFMTEQELKEYKRMVGGGRGSDAASSPPKLVRGFTRPLKLPGV